MTETLERTGAAMASRRPSLERMPGHWVLASLGKRVLRPGGLELTEQMLKALNIGQTDRVVEFAPGLGMTARRVAALGPASFTAIERDETASNRLNRLLGGGAYQCRTGSAEASGLEDGAADAVYGEAMLTMQTHAVKEAIVREAGRILAAGGRYGIHEIALTPDGIDEAEQKNISAGMSKVIHHGVNPLTLPEWERLLTEAGFRVRAVFEAPMALLEPRRFVRDEGILRSLAILCRLAVKPAARARVLEMRNLFKTHRGNLRAFAAVAEKI